MSGTESVDPTQPATACARRAAGAVLIAALLAACTAAPPLRALRVGDEPASVPEGVPAAPPPLLEGTPAAPAGGLGAAAPRQAAPPKLRHPRDRFTVRGGIQLFAGVDTELGLDVNGTPLSTTIDLEDALGLKSEVSTGRVDADLRLGRRNHILVSYFSMDRSASKSITEEIEFEDVVYEVGAEVTAKMNIDIVKASYRFDVWRDRRNELGLSIGAHTMVVELGLAGKAMVSGGGGGSVEASRSARGALPLPVVGIHFESLIARDLILRASTEALGLEFEDWGGYLIDTQVGLEWRFQRHFGLGLGYNRFVLKAWFDQDSFDGDFRYAYDGLLLNLTAAI